MTVIDVDAHYFEPFDWLEKTDPDLAAELPQTDKLTLILTTAFGEVLSALPPQYRPNPFSRLPGAELNEDGTLTPESHERATQLIVGGVESVPGGYDPQQRVDYLAAQGIDQQWVLPTFAFNPIAVVRREMPQHTARILTAYNNWSCEQLAGHTDKLVPVTIIDLRSMDKETVLAELKRNRERGSRSTLFWSTPVDGKSLSHPDLDWFWAACEDLGIMPMLHVGAGRPQFDLGWLNNGLEFPFSHAAYFGQLQQIPEIFLTDMIVGGVFERHPNLRVLICELGIDWLPRLLRRANGLKKMSEGLGANWPYPLKPSEYIRRNVRVSPLHTDPTTEVINEVGDGLVVFSSDYPHPEGGGDALRNFRAQLEGNVSQEAADAFFGATIEADLALTA
jgi:predicted TIM-barrel fold metal-dependent hydrolase